jgi:hypothetical protein
MVAFNKIRCTVVSVSELRKSGLKTGAIVRDVLPWADPYIAQLIQQLQDEVRMDREQDLRVPHNRITGVKVSAA